MIARLRDLTPARRTFWVCVGLALGLLITYWPVTRYGFVNFDDDQYVTANSHVQHGFTWDAIRWAFTTGHASNWHPLTWLSHTLDCLLFGANPGAMHLVNVLFHVASSITLFLLLRRLTGREGRSFVVALLFALHPLHVESVAWISERKDVLSTFFWFLALWQYTRYARDCARYAYARSLLFFALGLLAKPMLVTLPLTLLMLDFWPLKRLTVQTGKRLVFEKIPFFLLSLGSSVVTFLVQRRFAVIELDRLSIASRLGNALVSYVSYLAKTFWPSHLTIFYPHPLNQPAYQLVLASALLAGCSVGAVRYRARLPYLAFGWAWFLVTLVPVIGIVQVGSQAMADRYSYVPIVGIFIALVWGVSDLADRFRWMNSALPVTAAGLALACATASRLQMSYWKDSLSLFSHALAVTDRNVVANINLGAALMADGRKEEAAQHYQAALRIKPDNAKAQLNLGIALASLGRSEEAARHYNVALQIEPSFASNLKGLGDTLLKNGDAAGALLHYAAILRYHATDAVAQLDAGNALVSTGDFARGSKHLREAVKLDPTSLDARVNLASALAHEGQSDEAIAEYQQAILMDASAALPRYQLASTLEAVGRTAEAIAQLQEAVRLSPDAPLALNKLAWILCTSGDDALRDGKKAILLAEKASSLTGGRNPVILATLSAAYAEEGMFDKANGIAEAASKLNEADQDAAIAALLRNLTECFAAHRAFHKKSGDGSPL